ncbi:MAG: hypothetical protein HYY18_06515 [Planctomycetes bacterium]|nr:hypothetical protein [Planctomycetota bacterium]
MWLKLEDVVEDLLRHSGFGEIRISMRWVSRGRKEVIISYGKEFRFVLDAALPAEPVSNP